MDTVPLNTLAWFSVAGSNVFSNVPFVLVAGAWIDNFANPPLMWKVLALATTFAGNLTILGSVANIIVVESARGHCDVGFWDYACKRKTARTLVRAVCSSRLFPESDGK